MTGCVFGDPGGAPRQGGGNTQWGATWPTGDTTGRLTGPSLLRVEDVPPETAATGLPGAARPGGFPEAEAPDGLPGDLVGCRARGGEQPVRSGVARRGAHSGGRSIRGPGSGRRPRPGRRTRNRRSTRRRTRLRGDSPPPPRLHLPRRRPPHRPRRLPLRPPHLRPRPRGPRHRRPRRQLDRDLRLRRVRQPDPRHLARPAPQPHGPRRPHLHRHPHHQGGRLPLRTRRRGRPLYIGRSTRTVPSPNPVAYVRNPLGSVDPLGLSPCSGSHSISEDRLAHIEYRHGEGARERASNSGDINVPGEFDEDFIWSGNDHVLGDNLLHGANNSPRVPNPNGPGHIHRHEYNQTIGINGKGAPTRIAEIIIRGNDIHTAYPL